MVNYEIVQSQFSNMLKRTDEDGTVWWIPINPENADYIKYLQEDIQIVEAP